MHLPENIAFLLTYKKLSYAELGEAIGATEGMVKQYKRGATPPLSILCSIADYAGLSLDALVREKLTNENYTALHNPQGTPGAVNQLKEQLLKLDKRLTTLEKRTSMKPIRDK